MYTGYITNQAQAEVAREYKAALLTWTKRLQSMYLPGHGFSLYPPEEGGKRIPDTHYAPLGVRHLLNLPDAAHSGLAQPAVCALLDEIATMVTDAAACYAIAKVPRTLKTCHDAYQTMLHGTATRARDDALAFVRSRLRERQGQMLVEVAPDQPSYRLWGMAVSQREETAYAAATLLHGGAHTDLPRAIAATNYLAGQINAEGRLYSTVDSAACLALLLALRAAGVITTQESGRVALNGQQMSLADALAFGAPITAIRALEGVIAVEVTAEVIEDWSILRNELPVEVRLERNGRAQRSFHNGDALELVVRVRQYQPGLIVHVCLPDALARVVGGGQVKRFSLDFCERQELRVPLAVLASTSLPGTHTGPALLGRSGPPDGRAAEQVQHWAVIVRNMFKEEQIGNPGILEVRVD